LFSKAGLVWDELRNSVETENANAQLFLRYFLEAFENKE
jgi:hypothetical protein